VQNYQRGVSPIAIDWTYCSTATEAEEKVAEVCECKDLLWEDATTEPDLMTSIDSTIQNTRGLSIVMAINLHWWQAKNAKLWMLAVCGSTFIGGCEGNCWVPMSRGTTNDLYLYSIATRKIIIMCWQSKPF
jgi:hypothetical protein